MSRLPIRLRLALLFAAAAAVLLSAVGVFGYLTLAAGLSADLDRELQQRAQDLVGPMSRPRASLGDGRAVGFIELGESFAEVITGSGRVLDASGSLHRRRLLSPAEAARAASGTITVDRGSAPGLNEPARLLATPFSRRGRSLVLVVGATRENGLEALRRVRAQLLVALPVLVVAVLLGAYAVAGAALRPVEAMRRRAAELTVGDPAVRLPIPRPDDEVSRLGRTLNAFLERIEATLERERTFVAHASHELRTPLTLLRTELELALRRPREASELRTAIESAATEVDRLERLTEDLLLLAQAAEDRLAVRVEPVLVDEVFTAVQAWFAPVLDTTGRRVEVVPSGTVLLADRRHLHQALTNLVANALSHGDGDIRLQARSRPGHVDLVVTDTGAGFPADVLDHAVERFVRGRDSAGAGLGLSIVDAIGRAHGGGAGIRNRADGAEAWITLPVSTPTALAPVPGAVAATDS